MRTETGWGPISFQNSLAHRVAVHLHDNGTIEVDEKEQADLVSFCNEWMHNIQEQQGLSPRGRSHGAPGSNPRRIDEARHP